MKRKHQESKRKCRKKKAWGFRFWENCVGLSRKVWEKPRKSCVSKTKGRVKKEWLVHSVMCWWLWNIICLKQKSRRLHFSLVLILEYVCLPLLFVCYFLQLTLKNLGAGGAKPVCSEKSVREFWLSLNLTTSSLLLKA